MRRPFALFLACLLAAPSVHAGAEPLDPPPAGFAGRQYIDGSGCVFVRQGDGWTPRLDAADAPVCGYPPTQLSRDRPAPLAGEAGMDPRLVPDGMGEVEATLLQAVTGAMAEGDFVAGLPGDDPPAPAAATAAAGPPAADTAELSGVGDSLNAAIRVAPAVAATLSSAASRDSRLCTLIGAAPAGAADGAGLGATALGTCGTAIIAAGAAADGAPPAALMVPGADDAEGAEDAPGAKTRHAEAAGPARTASPAATAARRGAGDDATSRRRKAAAASDASRKAGAARPSGAEGMPVRRAAESLPMIPPGARFFILSREPDEAAAKGAAARLAGRGFPAAIGRPAAGGRRAVMAGPFDGREAMIRALDRLRRAGYPNPVPR